MVSSTGYPPALLGVFEDEDDPSEHEPSSERSSERSSEQSPERVPEVDVAASVEAGRDEETPPSSSSSSSGSRDGGNDAQSEPITERPADALTPRGEARGGVRVSDGGDPTREANAAVVVEHTTEEGAVAAGGEGVYGEVAGAGGRRGRQSLLLLVLRKNLRRLRCQRQRLWRKLEQKREWRRLPWQRRRQRRQKQR